MNNSPQFDEKFERFYVEHAHNGVPRLRKIDAAIWACAGKGIVGYSTFGAQTAYAVWLKYLSTSPLEPCYRVKRDQ